MAIAFLPVFFLAAFPLLFVCWFLIVCVRLLFRRQDKVLLSRSEAQQLAKLERGLEKMEERIGNMETILLSRDPAVAEPQRTGVS
jgi:phage shock protein B